MPAEFNLYDAILEVIGNGSVALVIPDSSDGLVYGKAAVAATNSFRILDLAPIFQVPSDPLSISQPNLIVMGCSGELCEDALRFVQSARYPQHHEVTLEQGTYAIRSLHSVSDLSNSICTGEDYGLFYLAQSADVEGRPTMFLSGTSAAGVEAAAMWINLACIVTIPPPLNFPNHPIEALIQVRKSGPGQLNLSDLHTISLACGDMLFDPQVRSWKESKRLPLVRVIRENDIVSLVEIDGVSIPVKLTDKFKLLLLLIQRSRKHLWTTFEEAQLKLDGFEDEDRVRSLMNRRKDIEALSDAPGFLVETTLSNGKRAFMLQAKYSEDADVTLL